MSTVAYRWDEKAVLWRDGLSSQVIDALEDLARKYKDKGIVVLAINGLKGQKPFRLPFLQSQGYDFVPLQADMDWDSKVYHVTFYPTSFLIGRTGDSISRCATT